MLKSNSPKRSIKNVFFALAVLSAFYAQNTIAAPTNHKYPPGCREVGQEFHGELLVLSPIITEPENPQTLYLVHNLSYETILVRVNKSPNDRYSPSYENYIEPGDWASFAMDIKALGQNSLPFVCQIGRRYGQGEMLPCSQVLELCQYTRAKFPNHSMGNYWVIHSDNKQNTIQGTIDNGILLRW